MKRKLTIVIASILLIMFTAVAVTTVKSGERIQEFNKIQLQNRDNELKLEQIESNKLKLELNNGQEKSQQEIDRLNKEIEERKKNEERLQSELQAKLDRQKAEQDRIASAGRTLANTVTATQTASAAPRAFSGGGNKETWLRASGIPENQWSYVDSIVSRESGWNPCAYNPGRSDCSANPTSACGLAQSLPCGKQSKYGHWTDPVANLKWQYEYVTARYGGYPQAVAFWNANHWY